MEVITIREMTVADLGKVVALESMNQPRPWTEGVFSDELAAEGRIYLVAEDTDLLGFGGVMLVGEEAHVTNLLVDPSRRRQGVGRTLMVELTRSAVRGGARHITLEVRPSNDAARRLYSGLGLSPVGVRPGYFGDEAALIMWRHDIDDPAYLEGLT